MDLKGWKESEEEEEEEEAPTEGDRKLVRQIGGGKIEREGAENIII